MSIRQIGVSLSEGEREELKEIADKEGCSISHMARQWIINGMADWQQEKRKVVAKSVFANLGGKKRA